MDLTKGFVKIGENQVIIVVRMVINHRIAILKEYADYKWSLDPDFYVIFFT